MYRAAETRYDRMQYRRCGRSGLSLPAISLGLWHHVGGVDSFETGRAMVRRAFDLGIAHFDLANNDGSLPGSAEGVGGIAFSPLAQGLLTDKYLAGEVPAGSRASKPHGFLRPNQSTPEALRRVQALNAIAQRRGQSLAQIALAWVLRYPQLTSALLGASKVSQIELRRNADARKLAAGPRAAICSTPC